jgi:malate permease and related proteins
MNSIILLFVCLMLGILLQRVRALPKDSHVTLNIIILHMSLPALALVTVPNLEWRFDLFSLILVQWIIFGMSFCLFRFVGRKWDWPREVVGCLILTSGLGNTAFVGFPVVEALFGKESLKHAVLLDQGGSFLIVSSLGIMLATYYSTGKMRRRDLAKRIFSFPPFLAFLAALILGVLSLPPQGVALALLERLASTLTPLALLSVGLQLRPSDIKHEVRYLVAGLGFKLLLAPLLIATLYHVAKLEFDLYKVAVIESAMAPMITASILAASHGLAPRLAGLMIGLGVPLSFFTLSLWYLWLRSLS